MTTIDSNAQPPSRPPFHTSPLFWSGLAGLLVAIPLGLKLLYPPAPLPPVYASVGDFALADQDGGRFDLQRMRGRVWIANFIFTSCPTVCPLLTERMGGIQRALAARQAPPEVQLVSFSVDPDTDTPPVLKEYGAKFGRDPERWNFVTGDPATLTRTVEEGFKVLLQRTPHGVSPHGGPQGNAAPSGFDIVHGEHFVLVDRDGGLRGFYRNEPESLDRLIEDALRLQRASASR